MLRELHVRNIAVVAEAAVELGPGLNALTGETGAGKSIVVDSLALLAGARASTDLIRSGADALAVTGIFTPDGPGWRLALAEAGLEAEGDDLLVRREIGRAGRSRVFVNDQPATVRLLAALAPELLRIHGQREELGLAAPDLQRQWLDASGGARGAALVASVGESFERWQRLAGRLERLSGDERARRERSELLAWQAREIDAAGLSAGEEEGLKEEREVLRHREAIRQGLGGAFSLLFDEEGAAAGRAARARALLEDAAAWEPRAGAWAAEIEEVRIRLEEAAREIGARLAEIEANPARLDHVEERLATVERLCQRYGGMVGPGLASGGTARVLDYRREIEVELAELEGDAAGRDELAAAAAAALAGFREEALELSRARAVWGEELARGIERELADLGLAKARLAVRLERRPRSGSPLAFDGMPVDFGREGLDQVVFEFAADPGEPARPLARVASGGELSRLYLALQVAVAAERAPAGPTLVFDEIDAGVGGAQAAALGRKLQRLAGGGQILVVTHLPQVASHADLHLRVAKSERRGRTFTEVERLGEAERVEELARMLAGSRVTDTSRSHARELLAAAARPPAPPPRPGRR